MNSDFHFALLRISIAQMLRAAGIDRCSPSVLDTITDLFIRHLTLLSTSSTGLANLSGRTQVTLADVSQSMANHGVISPTTFLDNGDIDPRGMEGVNAFVNWAKGEMTLRERQMAGLAVIAANTASSDPDSDISGANEPTSTQNNDSTTGGTTEAGDKSILADNTDQPEEWLVQLMRKQVKIGHEGRFKGTILVDGIYGDDDVNNIYNMGMNANINGALITPSTEILANNVIIDADGHILVPKGVGQTTIDEDDER